MIYSSLAISTLTFGIQRAQREILQSVITLLNLLNLQSIDGWLSTMTDDSSQIPIANNPKLSLEFQLLEKIRQAIALGFQAQSSIVRLRREVAELWMAAKTSTLEARFQGALGDATRELILAGISNQPSTPGDQRMLDQIDTDLGLGFVAPAGIRALLAAMCMKPADHLQAAFEFQFLPDWLMDPAMQYLLLGRNFFNQVGEPEHHCDHLSNVVDSALRAMDASAPQKADLIAAYCLHRLDLMPFYFQEGNPRPIIEKRAQLFRRLYPPIRAMLPPPSFGPAASKGRIRLGILRPRFEHGAESCATLPVFEHLDRERFDITLFALKATTDPFAGYCAARADRALVLFDDLEECARAIRNSDLDILFYGSNLATNTSELTMLASERLARVQVASICSPFTTGLPEIDCFIAGTLTESEAVAENGYCEELFRLEGSGICFSLQDRPRSSGLPLGREFLGISEKSVVFASGANLFKLLPELREAWAMILAATPDSRLLLYPFGPGWSNGYPRKEFFDSMQRVFAAHEVDMKRLITLETMPSSGDVLEALRSADVYLDSFPYSGATSLQDPLDLGIPIVTLDGKVLRFSQGPALLRELNLDELIASNAADYVALAVKLGTDSEYRSKMRHRVQSGMNANPPFRDAQGFAKKIAQAFESIVNKWNLDHALTTGPKG